MLPTLAVVYEARLPAATLPRFPAAGLIPPPRGCESVHEDSGQEGRWYGPGSNPPGRKLEQPADVAGSCARNASQRLKDSAASQQLRSCCSTSCW